MLHGVDAGQRGFRAPGGVLVHEDRQAASVRASAGASRRFGPRRDVELDPVDPGVGQRVDLGLDAIGVDVPAESREARIDLAFLEHRPGEEDARPGSRARRDGAAVGREVGELSTEVEHGRDSRGEEELRVPLVARVDVHVHVDQAGYQELAAPVDGLGTGRGRRGRRGAHGGQPLALNHDCGVLHRRAASPVDQDSSLHRQGRRSRHHDFANFCM